MPVQFLKDGSQIVDVSVQTPLPVSVREQVAEPRVEVLWVGLTTVTTASGGVSRDLNGSTGADDPTLVYVGEFRQFVWVGRKSSTTDALDYVIQARATDLTGNPLDTGWITIAQGTISASDTWFRVVFPSDGAGGFDQIRIGVSRTTGSDYTLQSKVWGIR